MVKIVTTCRPSKIAPSPLPVPLQYQGPLPDCLPGGREEMRVVGSASTAMLNVAFRGQAGGPWLCLCLARTGLVLKILVDTMPIFWENAVGRPPFVVLSGSLKVA
jgi:hypothetical protein